MVDKYSNYDELSNNEEKGKDYRIRCIVTSDIAIIAIHGGGIEPGTTEIAEAVAGSQYSFYTFEGLKPTGNRDLHITSTKFDEPIACEVVRQAKKVVSIHGCNNNEHNEKIVHLGCLDEDLKQNIKQSLKDAGFSTAEPENHNLQGNHPLNICNRGQTGQGVQLEITRNLRDSLLEKYNKKKFNEKFNQFVTALRNAVSK